MIAGREYFVTPSGSTAHVKFVSSARHPHRDREQNVLSVSSPNGGTEGVNVALDAPVLINSALQQNGFPPLDQVKNDIVYIAAITNYDRLSTLPVDESGRRLIEVDGQQAIELLSRPPVSDREVRRFIVRRVYQIYSRSTLQTQAILEGFDSKLLGTTSVDMLRNAQVLEAEGYLTINSASGDKLVLTPTVKLVREVERFGAAKEDVVTDRDYLEAIRVYPSLTPHIETLELEYRRYSAARSETELRSVFKAVSPVVEAIVKELLRARGSTQQHATLGPAIAELQARGIGGPGLLTQLNHILKFGRDLTQHGELIPASVLRIACENTFELVPQLASLFPRSSGAGA